MNAMDAEWLRGDGWATSFAMKYGVHAVASSK